MEKVSSAALPYKTYNTDSQKNTRSASVCQVKNMNYSLTEKILLHDQI